MPESCEQAIVRRIEADGRARVVVTRAEACHACAAKGACQVLGGQTQDVELVVTNPVGARAGDLVRLVLPETSIVKASTVLYLVPALGLMGGAVIGHVLARRLAWSGDPAALAGALVGLLSGLGMAWFLGRRLAANPAYTPRLDAVLRRAAEHPT